MGSKRIIWIITEMPQFLTLSTQEFPVVDFLKESVSTNYNYVKYICKFVLEFYITNLNFYWRSPPFHKMSDNKSLEFMRQTQYCQIGRL